MKRHISGILAGLLASGMVLQTVPVIAAEEFFPEEILMEEYTEIEFEEETEEYAAEETDHDFSEEDACDDFYFEDVSRDVILLHADNREDLHFSQEAATFGSIYTWDTAEVAELRAGLIRKDPQITVCVDLDFDGDVYEQLTSLFNAAYEMGGNPTEGDYLRYQMESFDLSVTYDAYSCVLDFEISYYNTAAQEADLEAELARVIRSFGFTANTTAYEKVSTVYDYIRTSVAYDHENYDDPFYLPKYSAYAALINKKAVCQGYALLFQRFMCELGIPARCINGYGGGDSHMWNIVRLGSLYYCVDATWDADWVSPYYFLIGESQFRQNHIPSDEFLTEEFRAAYPISNTAYVPGAESEQDGWVKENGKWVFYQNGVKQTGWINPDGHSYYLNESGEMLKGWQKINGDWYFLNASGAMETGWICLNQKWYYLNASGVMQIGWQKIKNVWYYMNASGAMQTGWQSINGKWYYLNASGAMQTGWQKNNNVWYYMNASGVMLTGWQKISNVWYYMNASGAMQTGWQKINNVWYYFKAGGAMACAETLQVNGTYYSFSTSGAWVK